MEEVMKRPLLFRTLFLALFTLTVAACGLLESDPAGDPNSPVGGNTDLEDTRPGGRHVAFPELGSWLPYELTPKDSVYIKSRNGGIVTVDFNVTFDTAFTMRLDTLLGTQGLPNDTKMQILDAYLAQYGATIDTSNKKHMIIHAEPKFRVSSEGIQDFVASKGDESKPFTIIKYNMNVGDTWSFTRSDGVKVTRKVTYHSTTDDYEVVFWRLKVFKTEQVQTNDPLLSKIVWVTNHKYGLVGIHLFDKTGKEIPIKVAPPSL
ncbi:MAG: hypothetical protein NTX15_06920, partial [Candidatus Kapabacteria bacterium]|nr:hypothetical protein [Candidatus Kapabacteria bacterium]